MLRVCGWVGFCVLPCQGVLHGFGVVVFGVVGGVIQYLVSLGCMFWGVLRIQPPGHRFWALAGKAGAVEVSGNSSGYGTSCGRRV